MTSTAIRVVTGPANYYSYPGALQELENLYAPAQLEMRSGFMVNGRLQRLPHFCPRRST